METADVPHATPLNTVAADTKKFCEIAPGTDTPAGEKQDASPPARLLDSDPSKFRSLKRVIVIGRPGSGTDGEWNLLVRCGWH